MVHLDQKAGRVVEVGLGVEVDREVEANWEGGLAEQHPRRSHWRRPGPGAGNLLQK